MNSGLFEIKESWAKRLGLFPVPVTDVHDNSAFVMVNGGGADFSLYMKSAQRDIRSESWSADVAAGISIEHDTLELVDWSSPSKYERYSLNSVEDNLTKFYKFIAERRKRRELSIIPFSLDTFRQLSLKCDSHLEAIQCFLVLLSASIQNEAERSKIRPVDHGLSSDAIEASKRIPTEDWSEFFTYFTKGRPALELKNNPKLLIRHVSGPLFQEAHFELSRSSLTFPGMFATVPVATNRKARGTGVYYTPPFLARAIVEQALLAIDFSMASITVFDPCCGSGEFLKEAVRQLTLKKYPGKISVIGWDISPLAVEVARFVVAQESMGVSNVTSSIDVRNALAHPWPSGLSLILMNPPFKGWNEMTSIERDTINQTLGQTRKRPDMALAFLRRAIEAQSNEGVLGVILPYSAMSGSSSSEVRELADIKNNRLVCARLGTQSIFQGAMVDAGFYVGKTADPHVPRSPTVYVWASNTIESVSDALRQLRRAHLLGDSGPIDDLDFSVYSVRAEQDEDWAPRPFRTFKKLSDIPKNLPKVGSLFDVKQGTLTGLNSAFILTTEEFMRLSKHERKFFRPALLNASIVEGRIRNNYYVFYPYSIGQEIESENQLKLEVTRYYSTHLLPNKKDLQARAAIKERWWELTRPRIWQQAQSPKLVSKYFGKSGAFAFDPGGEFIVVQGYGWIPKKKSLDDESVYYRYLALLNSDYFSDLVSAFSTKMAGGQYNLSKRYMTNVPIPDLSLDSVVTDELELLGRNIQVNGIPVDNTLQAMAVSAYSLSLD